MSSRNILKHTANIFSPTDPSLGDEWNNTSNGRLYKYLAVNGTSPQWVELYSSVSSAGFTLPSWDNSTRPVSQLSLGFNKTNNRVEFYNKSTFTAGVLSLVAVADSTYSAEGWASGTDYSTLITGGAFVYTFATIQSASGGARSNALPSGKYYFEVTITTGGGGNWLIGMANSSSGGGYGNVPSVFAPDGGWYGGFVGSTGPGSFPNGSVIMFAYDTTVNQFWIGKNGTWSIAPTATGTTLPGTGAPRLFIMSGASNGAAVSGRFMSYISNTYATPSGFSNSVSSAAGSVNASWLNIQKRPTAFEYLLVGGGGGAGGGFGTNARGGGAGAGGVVYGNFQNYATGTSTFTITIGGGGGGGIASGGSGTANGSTGTNSSIVGPTSTTTALTALLTDQSKNAITVTNTNVTIVSTSSYGSYSGSLSFNATNQYLQIPVGGAGTVLDLSSATFTIECWVYALSTAVRGNIAGVSTVIVLNNASFDWTLYMDIGGAINFQMAQGVGLNTVTGGTIGINRWYHVAVTRTGASATVWVNGFGTTGAVVATSNVNNAILGIGAAGSHNLTYWNGYISNIRIVKGITIYTSNFTVPTEPLTVTQPPKNNIGAISAGQTSLLLGVNTNYLSVVGLGGGNGSGWDVRTGGGPGGSGGGGYTAQPEILVAGSSTQFSTYGYGLGNAGSTGSLYVASLSGAGAGGGAGGPATAGIAATGAGGTGGAGTNLYSSFLAPTGIGFLSTSGPSTTVIETTSYGPATGSLLFNGTNQYLNTSTAVTTFTFGSGNFTVEYWVYYNSLQGAYQHIAGPNALSANGFAFGIYGDVTGVNGFGRLYLTTSLVSYFTDRTIETNRWYHVAFVRTSGTLVAYANGVGSTPIVASVNCTDTGITVGALPLSGSYYSNAYVSNLRVTKGVAVYTSNFNFTKILPLTNTTNTQLLLLVSSDLNKTFDSSTLTNALINNNGVTFSTLVPSTSTTLTVFSGPGSYYIGAGGGGAGGLIAGPGGFGGGGNGATAAAAGSTGTQFTGGGGGGGASSGPSAGNGGAGGSGAVIIRYPEAYTTGTISTGSARVVVSGGYRNYVFTSSGVISF